MKKSHPAYYQEQREDGTSRPPSLLGRISRPWFGFRASTLALGLVLGTLIGGIPSAGLAGQSDSDTASFRIEACRDGSREDGDEKSGQLQLDQTYDDVDDGVRLVLAFDSDANTFSGTIENTTDRELNEVDFEIYLSNGTDLESSEYTLAPGESIAVAVNATEEPFDTWSAYADADDESDDSDDSSVRLSKSESLDVDRSGARLNLSFDADTNAFTGTVENTSDDPLCELKVEVELSNGNELKSSPPVDLAAGEQLDISIDASGQTFDSWDASTDSEERDHDNDDDHDDSDEDDDDPKDHDEFEDHESDDD